MDYVDQEADAQAARRGIWASEFVKPWEWRKRSPEASSLMLGAELCQELAKDAITKPVKLLNLPPAPQIGHHLGRDLADRAK